MIKKSYFEIKDQPIGTSFVIRFVKNPIGKSGLYFRFPQQTWGDPTNLVKIKYLTLAYVNGRLCCLLLPESIYNQISYDKFYSSDSNISMVLQVDTKYGGYRHYKVTEIQDDYFKISHDIVSELKTKDIDLYRSGYDIYKIIKDINLNLGVLTLQDFPFFNSYIRDEKINSILN